MPEYVTVLGFWPFPLVRTGGNVQIPGAVVSGTGCPFTSITHAGSGAPFALLSSVWKTPVGLKLFATGMVNDHEVTCFRHREVASSQ